MKIFQSLDQLNSKPFGSPPVGLTIGNFDGVHKGHRYLLQAVKKSCLEKNLQFVVITFIPHPHQILTTNFKHYLINSYDDRRMMMEELGVDFLVELDFNRDFSTMNPEVFLEKYLFNYKNIKEIHLGHDFAFGLNKKGTFELVSRLGAEKEIDVFIENEYKAGALTSSSQIRSLLRDGFMQEAQSLLGRNFYLSGRVIKGEGRGKKIGFPTANLQLNSDIIIPKIGVYITESEVKGMRFQSLTNVGRNPTFKDEELIHVETFLFDFNEDIYGEILKINFLLKIRDEIKFESVNKLIDQLKQDVLVAKKYFE
jgi:riboflavin kinase/FMN adenylyltransferase